MIKLNKKMASNEAKKAEHKVSTDSNKHNNSYYINFSNHDAENAPEAPLAGQQSNKLCLHRHLGSIPSWGAPSALNIKGFT